MNKQNLDTMSGKPFTSVGRYGLTHFCDDIRHEIRNKVSLMGLYGPVLILPEFPCVLNKICFAIHLTTPANQPFEKMCIRIEYKRDKHDEIDILYQQDVDKPTLTASNEALEQSIKIENKYNENHTRLLRATYHLMIDHPLFEDAGLLSVRAETECDVIKAGSLIVQADQVD